MLEVGEFYQLLTERLESAFGRRHPRWVRGEVAKTYEKTHLYVDLVDAGPREARPATLNAHCWATQWNPLKRRLASEGIILEAGMVVHLLGYVDLYAPQGRVGFTITDLDVAGLVGEVARRRAELIERLTREGLLETQRRLALGPVPLRLGLVASPGTEGFADFTGQLQRSGLAFEVTLAASAVQGEAAPAQLVDALERLDGLGLDALCVVRGGGSKGDLACFDDERVARAIAGARTPVLTGIGHTGDQSVADLVAHHSAITPTQLGEELVSRVATWRQRHVVDAALALGQGTSAILDEAGAYLGERRRTVTFAVRDRLRAEGRHLAQSRQRVGAGGRRVLEEATRRLAQDRQLLAAYDPRRRLAQGWALVSGADGRRVTSRGQVVAGERLLIEVSDGSFGATVDEEG